MKRLSIGLASLIAACSQDPGTAAEEQFDLAMRSGTFTDVCAAARRAADAALTARDGEEFERWRLTRDIYCMRAAQDPESMPSAEPPTVENSLSTVEDANRLMGAAD